MYCPKCGTPNIDDASFCRSCGANLSLVPQALTGGPLVAPLTADYIELPPQVRRRRRNRDDRPPSLDRAIKNFVSGLGFIFVALAARIYAPAGAIWWFWLLIPAFSMIGGGIAEYVRYKQTPARRTLPAPAAYTPPAVAAPPAGGTLPPRPATPDSYQPGSVTEHTTQLLDRDR